MTTFTKEELFRRDVERIAYVLHGRWSERRGTHTRIFDVLITDTPILAGKSINGGGHREHVVPCAYLRDRAYAMFSKGATQPQVADMLQRLLKVVYITRDEARRLDHELGLKATMPDGWCPETGDPMARLLAAGIAIIPSEEAVVAVDAVT